MEYSSGNWRVREGSDAEFVKRWTEFAGAAKNTSGRFVLIRETNDPRHYVSIGMWQSPDDIKKWMSSPGFQDMYDGIGSLCDEYHGGAFSVVTTVG